MWGPFTNRPLPPILQMSTATQDTTAGDEISSPFALQLVELPDPAATYAADFEVVTAFRRAPVWQPSTDLSPAGTVWYVDTWEVAGDVIAGWQASGGAQRRRCRLYLVRLPEVPKTRGATYPAERGRYALRDVESVGPAAGYGVTRLYRSEAAARTELERAACSAQAIGHFIGVCSEATIAADLAGRVAEIRQRTWTAEHHYDARSGSYVRRI